MARDDPAQFAPPPAFGPFRVLHQIGIGALGPVFRTYEPTRDRLVAVKVFRLDITPEQAQSLADELSRAADAGLFHPSIVEPIAAGVEGTVAYRAEEYVAAESLDVAIRHYAPAPLDKALPFITQLAGAIDFARAAGIGHGALHLRDVFVTPDEARAAGFGVVEALERVGLRAPIRRPYSAPERIAGQAWSTPADVFSLAAIAYELLTGRRPSGTGNQIGAPAGDNLGGHADSIRAVLARAMDDEPANRYATALAFASALEAAASGAHVAVPVVAGAVSAEKQPGAPAQASAAIDDERDDEDETAEEKPPQDQSVEELEEEEAIAAERDADTAHYEMSRREDADEDTAPSLFDDEAATDRAQTPGDFALAAFDSDKERENPDAYGMKELRWQDEEAHMANNGDELPSYQSAESGPVTPGSAEEYMQGVNGEPPRPAMLPLAITLILGLLIGFAAGYAVGGREHAEQAAAAPATKATPTSGQEARGQTPGSGKAWSEQAVAPPPAAAAPAPAADAPSPAPESVPPTEPAVRARAATGRIVVRSMPSRAGVTVNGQWRGRTPLTLDAQQFGDYTVRIVQPGFTVAREDFKLSASQPSRTLSFRLQRGTRESASSSRADTTRGRAAAPPAPRGGIAPPAPPARFAGSIYVDSRPRGARVLIDGRAVGTTPARIPDVAIGSHVVRLELPDHRAWTMSTRVAAGQETRVTGSLERIQ